MNKIEEVKKILEQHSFIQDGWNILPTGSFPETAYEICQLFEQDCKDRTDWDWIQKHKYHGTNLEFEPPLPTDEQITSYERQKRLDREALDKIANLVEKYGYSLNPKDVLAIIKEAGYVRLCARCGVIRTDNVASNICGSCADDLRTG